MKRLIVDMDDVLADASARIIEIFNQKNNQNITKAYFDDKDFYGYVKQNHFVSFRDELYKPGFFRNLEVFPDAKEVMEELYQKYDLYIVSAAVEFPNSLIEKVDWLKEHFPFITWQKIVFCGDKSIVDGDIMIDDHARNFKNFSGEKLLYHSVHNTQEQGYKRVKNWKEIYEILK